jgi:hypothetical protein
MYIQIKKAKKFSLLLLGFVLSFIVSEVIADQDHTYNPPVNIGVVEADTPPPSDGSYSSDWGDGI